MQKKHDYDKILTRLSIILQRLYEGESLSVADLSEEFNVSSKTIQRDFNERLIRFPIEKVGRKWKMISGHQITRERSPEEMLVLEMLGNIAQSIGAGFGSKAKTLFSKLQNHKENPIYSRTIIEDISDNISKKQNILITGATGVGKSFLAQALARAAIFEGHSARYYRVSRVLEEIKLARHAGNYTKTLEQLSKYAVLILDDFGVSPLSSDEVKDLFEVIEERTLSGSTIITAQLPVKEWCPKGISSLRSGHTPISKTTPSPMQ